MSRLIFPFASIAFCLVPLWIVQAQTLNIAGKVTAAAPDAITIDANNDAREITRRSPIYIGDSIRNGDKGSVQVRMIDAALVSLRCNSSLKIQFYEFEAQQTDSAILKLHEGSLRTITGSIGKQNLAQYRLNVGSAWVNSPSADFEASLDDNGMVYFGVYGGSITVSNTFGSAVLGIGGSSDYARVEPNEPPIPMLLYPQQLGSTTHTASPAVVTASNCP